MIDYSDIYIKSKNDPFYDSTKVETKSFLDGIISKIYMILMTNKGDVLGDKNFGADIPMYLWKTKFSASTIQQNIIEQFQEYIPELGANDYKVNVYLLPGTVKDIGVINIDLGVTNINVMFK